MSSGMAPSLLETGHPQSPRGSHVSSTQATPPPKWRKSSLDQFGYSDPVARPNGFDREHTPRQIAEELDFRPCVQARSDEVDHLGDHEVRNYQRAWMGLQQFEAGGVVAVIGVDVGVEWSGIHDRSEEHTSELQSRQYLVCRLLLEKK